MGISRTEAAAALTDIEQTTGRAQVARGYRISSPIFMTWGVIWIIGYLAMGLLPQDRWGELWIPLDIVGFGITVVLTRHGHGAAGYGTGRGGAGAGMAWRSTVFGLTVMAFAAVTFTLFKAVSTDVYLVYPGLICGLIYTLLGVWRMTRFAVIGVLMFAASLAGYYLLQPWLAFWMAGVGGVGLLLGGLWMRRA